jgi:hypothetical protein
MDVSSGSTIPVFRRHVTIYMYTLRSRQSLSYLIISQHFIEPECSLPCS